MFKGIENKTFPGFINFILDHPRNEHWLPFYRYCHYCEIKYDIIGRLEKFENHVRYIVYKNNLTHLLPDNQFKYHMHPSGRQKFSSLKGKSKSTIDEKVKQYFSQLSTAQLKRLYEMYKIDFEMFGYNKNKYT